MSRRSASSKVLRRRGGSRLRPWRAPRCLPCPRAAAAAAAAPPEARRGERRHLGHLGQHRLVGQPAVRHRRQRRPNGADQRVREAVPEHQGHAWCPRRPTPTPTGPRSPPQISGGSSTPDVFMGDVIWPAQFGAHQLALPLSTVPARRATGAGSRPAWSRAPPTRARSTARRCSRTRASCTTARTCSPRRACPVPTTWEQLETDAATLVHAGQAKYGFVWEGDSYEGLTCNFMEYLTDAGGAATNSAYTTGHAELAPPPSRRSRSCAA